LHDRKTTLVILLPLILLIASVKTLRSGAEPTTHFFRAYYASFDGDLSIQPSGSFSPIGSVSFAAGFKNSCVNLSAVSGGSSFLTKTLYVKGSFKMSFMIKIVNDSADVTFNFTRLGLKLAGSTEYSYLILGYRGGRIVVFKGSVMASGGAIDYGKWYNITVSLDVSRDYLTVLGNGSQLIQTSTSIAIHYLEELLLQIGVLNPQGNVEVYIDEFSMLVSPIVFTDKPVYACSSRVQVNITGDQFPSPNMEIALIRPDGSIIGRNTIPSVNVNSSRTSGFYGFSYSISLINPTPGSYSIRVNCSGFVTEYHFGVWDISKLWERKSSVNVKAGGFAPNSFVTLSVRNSTGEVLSQRFRVDQYGWVDQNMLVPVDLQLGVLNVYLIYEGTYDFSRMSGSTDFVSVTVVKATINVTVVTNASTYERVSPIEIRAYVKYKDGSIIRWGSIVKLSLIHEGVEKQMMYMDYTYDGYWFKVIRLKPSDELGNYVIRVDVSDPYTNSGAGNKTITITIAKLVITLTNQLEESYERSTKLNISVSVKYKDETPVDSGGVSLEMTRENRRKGPFPFAMTSPGRWAISYKIPISEQEGRWDLKITAVDDSGNMGDLSLSILIVPARLIIQPLEPLGHDFYRTQSIPISVVVKYPSYEVSSEENVVVNASLIHLEKGVVSSGVLRFSAGSWRGGVKVPKDAPLGECFLRIFAKDSYGNSGYLNNTVYVSKAILDVTVEDLKDVYQVGFDTVRLKCVVKYLDGSIMNEGNVTATFSSGATNTTIVLKYSNGEWVGEYGIPITAPTGDFVVSISVADSYGNTGVTRRTFRVSNLYMILVAASIAIALSVSLSALILRRRRSRALPIEMGEDYDLYG